MSVRDVLAVPRTVLLVSFISLIALLFLNGLSLVSTDSAELKRRITSGFASGALIELDYAGNDLRRGTHQFNDCLILQSTILGREDVPLWLLSARIVAHQPPCGMLARLARDEAPETIELYDYHRYMFGARPLTAWLVSVLDIDGARWAIRVSAYSLFFLALLVPVLDMAGWAGRRSGRSPRLFLVGMILIAGTFLIFYRLQHFAQTFGHGFAEIVIGAYLLASALSGPPDREEIAVLRPILFGTFTAWFELLTGPAPIGLILVMAVTAIGATAQDTGRSILRKVGWAVLGYAGALAATLALKVLAAMIMAGPDSVSAFLVHLAIRLQLHLFLDLDIPHAWRDVGNMTLYTPWDVGRRLAEFLPSLAYDSAMTAWGVLAAALLAAAGGTVAGMSHPVRRTQCLVLLAAMMLLPVWYLAFANHTVIHAWWMVRMIPAGMAAGFLTLLCGLAPDAWRLPPVKLPEARP